MRALLGILLCLNASIALGKVKSSERNWLETYGDRRLDQVSFLTAHNAFVNNRDSAWLAPNQGSASLREQLDNGVRALMLDLHSYKGQATLCHGSCGGFPLISPRQNLPKALRTVVDFMNQRREAIVTLFMEDYVSADEWQAAVDQVPGFEELQFDPYAEDVINQGWPTVNEMVNRNRRLLVISDKSDKRHLGVGFGQDLTVENYWSMGDLAKDRGCRSRWGHVPLNKKEPRFERLFVMNHFRNVPTALTAAIDNRFDDLWPRMERECVSAAGKKPNFIAVDYYNAASGGAGRVVDTLNESRGILFKDVNFTGATQMLLKGTIAVDHMIFGNDTISSLVIFPGGGRVRLYKDAGYRGLLIDTTTSMPYVGDAANDQASSAVIE